jgi:hypothetical protein
MGMRSSGEVWIRLIPLGPVIGDGRAFVAQEQNAHKFPGQPPEA